MEGEAACLGKVLLYKIIMLIYQKEIVTLFKELL
jgi:hypothetical protein